MKQFLFLCQKANVNHFTGNAAQPVHNRQLNAISLHHKSKNSPFVFRIQHVAVTT